MHAPGTEGAAGRTPRERVAYHREMKGQHTGDRPDAGCIPQDLRGNLPGKRSDAARNGSGGTTPRLRSALHGARRTWGLLGAAGRTAGEAPSGLRRSPVDRGATAWARKKIQRHFRRKIFFFTNRITVYVESAALVRIRIGPLLRTEINPRFLWDLPRNAPSARDRTFPLESARKRSPGVSADFGDVTLSGPTFAPP